MMFSNLIFWSLVTFSFIPNGNLDVYNNEIYPIYETHSIDYSFQLELEYNLEYKNVKSRNFITIAMWHIPKSMQFCPNQAIFYNSISYDFGNIRVGWDHTCAHSIFNYPYKLTEINKQLVPNYEGSFNRFFVQIRPGNCRPGATSKER